jgi:PncC family amidohydrolase
MTTPTQLNAEAARVGRLLRERGLKIVLAESCTGGLVSAALTTVPGISANHCGSAVVYQVETKARWLGISPVILEKPGPVSRVVAEAMARAVLEKTPHADLAAAVTGHLGPDAPAKQDGLVFVAVAVRRVEPRASATQAKVFVTRHLLPAPESGGGKLPSKRQLRTRRQRAAAFLVLDEVRRRLKHDR